MGRLLLSVVALALASCGGSTLVGAPDGGTGGSSGSGGTGGSSGSRSDGSIDCSLIGCAPPPLCSMGCTEICGCCACGEGMVQGNLVCQGGCWVPLADGGGAGCTYLGRSYPVGSTFNAGDGCNTCSCSETAAVGCTKRACVCDPAAESRRRVYVGMSPEACAAIDFVCTGTTTPFFNMCGCGCEQDPSCPEWFDCQPSPGIPPCDTMEIKMKCPYSGIAF